MSVPITSSLLFSNEGYPIPTAFAAGTTQRISVVNGPAYVTLESRRQSNGIYTSSANFSGATIDGASPTFSNVVDTSIVSGNFITAGVVGQKGRTGSLLVNINRDLPANEVFIKLESSNPDVYVSEIVNDASFVFNVKTDNAGASNNDQFVLPLTSDFGGGNTTSSVDWGDGNTDLISSSAQGIKTHTYSSAGTYTIKMTPTTGTVGIKGFRFLDGGDDTKVLGIENWGSINLFTKEVFEGCFSMSCTAPDTPFDFANDSSAGVGFTFNGCESLTYMDVTRWDLSDVQVANFMFTNCKNLSDFDPSGWDTSNLVNAKAMFKNCNSVDFSLADWDLSSMSTTNGIKLLLQDQPASNNTKISTANYDATLIGWAAKANTPDNLTTDFGDSQYTGIPGSLASSSRATLIQKGWSITDGGTASIA